MKKSLNKSTATSLPVVMTVEEFNAAYRATEVFAAEKVRKKLAELPATDAEAKCPRVPTCPPPAGAKYVHTFVCHGCKLDCTVEAVTDTPITENPNRCLFIGAAPWHLEATHTLTP